MLADPIARIRRFNRAVTLEAGALDASFLGRGRPLAAARTLYSIGAGGRDVAALREELRLDSGFLSRILRSLEAEGLVEVAPAPGDRRRRFARATAKGLAEIAEYDRLNDARAAAMLPADPRRRTDLLAAIDLVANALTRERLSIEAADPDDPRAQACLSAYFALLADRIPGLTRDHVPVPDPDAAAYRAPSGTFLLALSDGIPLACVSLKSVGEGSGEVKRLWVDPSARGLGLARRMMAAVEERARSLGLMRLRLDTNEHLPEAIALYRGSGWTEVQPFTPFPATHWFEKRLAQSAP